MKDNKAKISRLRHQGTLSSAASKLATSMDKEKRQQELNRERQRRYRERAMKDPDGLTRLQVLISANANGCLFRICEKTGMIKRDAIEKALVDMERTVTG